MFEIHPILKEFSNKIKDVLLRIPIRNPTTLPGINQRRKRTIQTQGGILYLYIGENSGFTLTKIIKKYGKEVKILVEVNCLRKPYPRYYGRHSVAPSKA